MIFSRKSKLSVILICTLCLLLSIVCVTQTIAWVQTNDSVAIDSGDLVSTQRGVAGGFESDLSKTSYLIGGTTGTIRQGYIPGDRKYYTFVISVPLETLTLKNNAELRLTISLEVQASATDTATGSSGACASFLGNLTVEQNAVEVAVLRKHAFAGVGGSVQYDVVPFAGVTHITNTTSPAYLSNAAVPSFYQNEICSCKTTIKINGAPWNNLVGTDIPWDDSGTAMVSLMVFLPIWYRDTDASQDTEKNCELMISDCKLTY